MSTSIVRCGKCERLADELEEVRSRLQEIEFKNKRLQMQVDSHKMQVESLQEECRELRANARVKANEFKEKTARLVQETENSLSEKLWRLRYKDSQLSSRNDYLASELRDRDAERHLVPRPSFEPMPLPPEILRHIFSICTDVDGLVYPVWDQQCHTKARLALRSRYSIPLVCRRWYNVGLEFLYRHVVLYDVAQAQAFVEGLFQTSGDTKAQRLGWMRGIELVYDEIVTTNQETYEKNALNLMSMLEPNQLVAFGVDCGACNGVRTATVCSIFTEAVTNHALSLQWLHLSCVNASLTPHADPMPSLRSLSFVGGALSRCDFPGRFSDYHASEARMPVNVEHVTSISFNASAFHRYHSAINCSSILTQAKQLEDLHIIIDRSTMKLWGTLHLLRQVPTLTRLTITPTDNAMNYDLVEPSTSGEELHSLPNLEEIVISLNYHATLKEIRILQPLIYEIKVGKYPQLRRVVVQGVSISQYLDEFVPLSDGDRTLWQELKDTCSSQNIALTTTDGSSIRLWKPSRIDILEFLPSSSNSASEEDDDSESDWFEAEIETPFSQDLTERDKCDISDPEDSSYQYSHQPDLETTTDDMEKEW